MRASGALLTVYTSAPDPGSASCSYGLVTGSQLPVEAPLSCVFFVSPTGFIGNTCGLRSFSAWIEANVQKIVGSKHKPPDFVPAAALMR